MPSISCAHHTQDTDAYSNAPKMAKLEVAARPVIITTNPGTPTAAGTPPAGGTPPPQPAASPAPQPEAHESKNNGSEEPTSLEDQVCCLQEGMPCMLCCVAAV